MRITLLLAFLIIPAIAVSQAGRETHTVRSGETLYSISQQYDLSLDQLREWNDIEDTELQIGRQLYLSPASGESAPAADDPEREHQTTGITPSEGDTTIHVVEAGQTLFRISRMYNVPVEDIRDWNDLASTAISIGQELVIITRQQDAVTEAAERADESSDEASTTAPSDSDAEELPTGEPEDAMAFDSPEPAYYEVRPGDTLYRIAARFNMEADELIELNQLDDTTLQVGQELRIRRLPSAPPSVAAEWERESTPQGKFVSHTVTEQDSIPLLLHYHGMDRYDFRALNPGVSTAELRPGDQVTLLLEATANRRNPFRVNQTDNGLSTMEVTRYPQSRRGTTTTSGELYNPDALTAAHPEIPLGSVIHLQNPDNDRGIYVLVNDRTSENRLILSDTAFKELNFTDESRLVVSIDKDTQE